MWSLHFAPSHTVIRSVCLLLCSATFFSVTELIPRLRAKTAKTETISRILYHRGSTAASLAKCPFMEVKTCACTCLSAQYDLLGGLQRAPVERMWPSPPATPVWDTSYRPPSSISLPPFAARLETAESPTGYFRLSRTLLLFEGSSLAAGNLSACDPVSLTEDAILSFCA